MSDRVIIENGVICDGSGREPEPFDLLVENGVISDIAVSGTFSGLNGKRINAAAGWTTGLTCFPGKFADTTELLALSEVTASSRKIYAPHMRSEGDQLIESVEESVRIASAGFGCGELAPRGGECVMVAGKAARSAAEPGKVGRFGRFIAVD